MVVYLNGKFLPLSEAKVSVLEPGLFNGYGVFETMRAYKGDIVYLDAHLERFGNSARFLKLRVPSKRYLKYIIQQTVRKNKFRDVYVKLVAFQAREKTNITIIVKKYHPYPESKYQEGFKIMISPFCWSPDLRFSHIKTLSRGLLELAYNEAKEAGFDEAILLNDKGHIVEGSRTNIFLVKDKKIYTPSLDCGCLAGITRKVVLDLAKTKGIRVFEKRLKPKDIFQADEVFLTNSLMGIMPVGICDKKRIGYRLPAKLTQIFMKEYSNIQQKEKLCLRSIR